MSVEITKEKHESTWTKYKYFCSRCKEPAGDSEAKSSYDVREVKIEFEGGVRRELVIDPAAQLVIHEKKKIRLFFKEGSSYPEGASIEAQVIDCCSKCWEEAVLPALALLGFEVRTEDRSW